MTTAERMKVAERWQASAGKRLRVIVHVGHTSLGDSRALAAHAQNRRVGGRLHGALCFKPTKAMIWSPSAPRSRPLRPSCLSITTTSPASPGVTIARLRFPGGPRRTRFQPGRHQVSRTRT
jgi:hypothetical protein